MHTHRLTPKLFSLYRSGELRTHLAGDIVSGLIVAIIALPLAVAFSIASNVPPQKGLLTAIIASFAVSTLGGSRVQIAGPTGAFVLIIFDTVQRFGLEGLAVATLMAGILIMLSGLAGLGSILKYIPYTLILGFTSGIALVIFTTQIGDLFGIPTGEAPARTPLRWVFYLTHLRQISPYPLAIGLATIGTVLGVSRRWPSLPGSLIALIGTTIVVRVFDLPVETIGSRFSDLSLHIEFIDFGSVSPQLIGSLLPSAFSIALLGSIESLLSAVVADGMTGGNHRPDAELTAQGVANILSAFFGGIPATGAIARTASNVKNGGRTPVSGIVHALALALLLILASDLLSYIPLATLAGILVCVSFGMSEARTFLATLKTNGYDVAVLVTTFLITVLFDLVLAIEVGMILASFLVVKRISDSFEVQRIEDGELFEQELGTIPEGVFLYEIHGSLLFGAAQRFYDTLRSTDHSKVRLVILRMRDVHMIDTTGRLRLEELIAMLRRDGIPVGISGASSEVKGAIIRGGKIPEELFVDSPSELIRRTMEASTD